MGRGFAYVPRRGHDAVEVDEGRAQVVHQRHHALVEDGLDQDDVVGADGGVGQLLHHRIAVARRAHHRHAPRKVQEHHQRVVVAELDLRAPPPVRFVSFSFAFLFQIGVSLLFYSVSELPPFPALLFLIKTSSFTMSRADLWLQSQ